MRETELALLNVEQRIEFDGGAVMAVDFELRSDGDDDAIRGRLEVDCTLALTPMADSLDLRTAARRLRCAALAYADGRRRSGSSRKGRSTQRRRSGSSER